jgi:hypothetical protein
MRLRNPSGLEQAIVTVREVKGQLMNTVAGDSARRKDDFLAWFDQWATPQLGNHFPSSEGIFAEIADSSHRLVLAPPMSERQMNGLLHRESQEWDARLQRVLDGLEALRTFISRPGHLIVLDTSALIEGVFFTDFDWHSLDASLSGGAIRLIVPSLVVEEPDELKRRPGERQRALARGVLTALWICIAQPRPRRRRCPAAGRHDRGAAGRRLASADAEQRPGRASIRR